MKARAPYLAKKDSYRGGGGVFLGERLRKKKKYRLLEKFERYLGPARGNDK